MSNTYYSTANNFHQISSNLEKMGAYYTDVDHCRSLSTFLDAPEEVACLEPSIGDGSAILACTSGFANARIFGVELNDETYEHIKDSESFESILKADFLTDVIIKNGVFTFMFGNPPYMENQEAKERMELSFIKKAYNYLAKGAVIVWVIPHRVFADEKYMRFMYSRFDLEYIFRFRPNEFKKWGQIAFIGRKKEMPYFEKEAFESYQSKYKTVEDIPELPKAWSEEYGDKVSVNPSNEADVFPFHAKEFDDESVIRYLNTGASPSDKSKAVAEQMTLPRFSASQVGSPIIPLKKDLTVLLSVCGVGQGLVGTEGIDLHLQRGTAEVVEETVTEKNEKGEWVDKVTSRTAISMCIIQQDGTISRLV